MKLTRRQTDFLWKLVERPQRIPVAWPGWLHALWAGDYFDAVGKSAYINDKGRAAIRPIPEADR